MNQKDFFNTDTIIDVISMEQPSREDADLAHDLSSYTYQMKFNSDKFEIGGFKCF